MSEHSSDPDISGLCQIDARRIIEDVGGTGQPPIYGYQFFTAGIDQYIRVIEDEYLTDYINAGGSSFKMVIGTYGGGKTHFLYSVQGRAWNHSYITSYIELSQNETPFHKLEEVYKAIVLHLVYFRNQQQMTAHNSRGIEALIRVWYAQEKKIRNHLPPDEQIQSLMDYSMSIGPYESTSFQNAIRHAFDSLIRGDEEAFSLILQWLKGENPPKTLLKEYKIFEKIEKTTAFKMIRCLIQWILEMGYAGLIVLMDEAEQTPSMSTKQRETLLNNLREIVDACSKGAIKGTMIFYAAPNEQFLEGRTAVYEALNQRLSTYFEGVSNPTGVKINLENLDEKPLDLLQEIGYKLSRIYEIAYGYSFDQEMIRADIAAIAEEAYNDRFGDIGYKRRFVQKIIKKFREISSS
jgi:hypothetical protein